VAVDNNDTNGLTQRIEALESEIDTANGSGTLDDRFDAIEQSINDIQSDTTLSNTVNTIGTAIGL